MTCEGKEECPIHGRKFWKKLRVIVSKVDEAKDSYCAGCHAGDMAAEREYISGLGRQQKQEALGKIP